MNEKNIFEYILISCTLVVDYLRLGGHPYPCSGQDLGVLT